MYSLNYFNLISVCIDKRYEEEDQAESGGREGGTHWGMEAMRAKQIEMAVQKLTSHASSKHQAIRYI